MAIIDFREIPCPTSGHERDSFELFARAFLEFQGFKIIVGPDRGPDAGRDLIIEERRAGIAGETHYKWLVSCKHKAHSGSSVTPEDESDINDRVQTHACQGFLGFYSTIPSSGLAAKFNAPNRQFGLHIIDQERIEKGLLSSVAGIQLAKRFFPNSMKRWEAQTPATIFTNPPALLCHCCGKDLLTPKPQGIVVEWETMHDEHLSGGKTQHVLLYWCCKGGCDRALQERFRQNGIIDGWKDFDDLIVPVGYIQWVMVMLNELHNGEIYLPEAFANAKKLLLNLFPFVSKHMTEEDKSRVKTLSSIPSYLGGLG